MAKQKWTKQGVGVDGASLLMNRILFDTPHDVLFAQAYDPDNHLQLNKVALDNAKRLASCWNACLNFDNPETDIPKLIKALHLLLKGQMKETDSNRVLERSCPNDDAIIKGFEALALYKEGG